MRRPAAAAVVALGLCLAGCGGGSAPKAPPGVRTPPSIAALLRQPIATPSICPSEAAQSTGLRSPWSGHVDISVYLKPSARTSTVTRLARELNRTTIVQRVYYESRAEAFAEFQRLYTCWGQVPRSQVPASYRIVLIPTATISQRNTLVAQMLHQPGVDSASCDPTLPCVDVVRSASTH